MRQWRCLRLGLWRWGAGWYWGGGVGSYALGSSYRRRVEHKCGRGYDYQCHGENGEKFYERASINKINTNSIPKKRIENAYMKLCFNENKVLTIDELKLIDQSTYELVHQYQGIFSKLQGATRRKMEVENLFFQQI